MEILNTYIVYDEVISVLPIFPLLATVIFGAKTIIELLNREWKTVIVSILITLVCLVVFNISVQCWTNSELTRYEVLITDYNKVDFNEYKIIETRGKITVLEEIKH